MPRRSQFPGELPANDNESPDESWRRADIILEAYSGADLNVIENQKLAITQLLTDLMHYCDTMNTGVVKSDPNVIDFDKLLQTAKENFEVQDLTMKSVMDATLERHEAYVDRKLSELKSERNDGTLPPYQPQYDSVPSEARPRPGEDEHKSQNMAPTIKWSDLMADEQIKHFIQEPEFLKLEKNLLERQEREAKELEQTQMQARIELGRKPETTRSDIDEMNTRQMQERREQGKTFKDEHDRHIEEYEAASKIRVELLQQEKQQGKDESLDKGYQR